MNLLTTGNIANKLGVDRDAVNYALRRANVAPVGRAGIVRLFSEDSVEAVRKFLKQKRCYRRRGNQLCSA